MNEKLLTKSIEKILWIIIVYLIFILPFIKYVHSKTIWEWVSDCMIEYVTKYYPNGCTYKIYGKYPHIDKCWIWNDYMKETKKIKHCFVNDNVTSFIYNTPYCMLSLQFEKIF